MFSVPVFARDDCTNSAGGNTCEKAGFNSTITAAVIGSISGVLLVILITVLYIFHRRRTQRDNQEWTKDPQELDDYGMGTTTTIKSSSVKPPQQAHHHDRPSKDADGAGGLGVPNNRMSVDSTQSLARQLRQHDDTFNSTPQVPRSLV